MVISSKNRWMGFLLDASLSDECVIGVIPISKTARPSCQAMLMY